MLLCILTLPTALLIMRLHRKSIMYLDKPASCMPLHAIAMCCCQHLVSSVLHQFWMSLCLQDNDIERETTLNRDHLDYLVEESWRWLLSCKLCLMQDSLVSDVSTALPCKLAEILSIGDQHHHTQWLSVCNAFAAVVIPFPSCKCV